jgi:integrase
MTSFIFQHFFTVSLLAFELMIVTGLRISEQCALNLSYIRPDTGEFSVFGKGAKERIVLLIDPDLPLSSDKRGIKKKE